MNHSFDFSTVDKFKIVPHLSDARFALIDEVIKTGAKIPYKEAVTLIDNLNLNGTDIIEGFVKSNIVGVNEDRDICYLYPVSSEETGHRVRLADGREFSTMCAIDSLGCAATFGMDAEIFSFCKDTHEKVYAKISHDKILCIEPSNNLFVSYYDSWVEGTFNF